MTDIQITLPQAKLEGSDTAPIISFDAVPVVGIVNGVVGLTLEAKVHFEGEGGQGAIQRVAVAHLRATTAAIAALRAALDRIELAASKTQGAPN